MDTFVRRATCVVALVGALIAALPLQAGADSASAVAYLATTQDAFGGWDGNPATSSEFTTSEVILAIAETAQTGTTWNATTARNAVDAVQNGGQSPLDFMDTAAETPPFPVSPGKAAKWIVNVAQPLGLSASAFDPAGDGTPVNLVALMGAPGVDGSFGTGTNFNGAAYAALASFLLNGSVPTQTVTHLRGGQTADGGFAFNGDPSGATPPDNDTTSLVVEALIAAGVPTSDPAITNAFEFLATVATGGGDGYDNATGNWIAFGGPSPESTSRAAIMIQAAGYDLSDSCWRDTANPALAGTAYVTPFDALLGSQNVDGSWGTPPFNDFTTAQAAQGLDVGTWYPIVTAAAQTCDVPVDPTVPVAVPFAVDPLFTG